MVSKLFLVRMKVSYDIDCTTGCGDIDGKGHYKVASRVQRRGLILRSGEEFAKDGKPYYVGYWCADCMRGAGLLW